MIISAQNMVVKGLNAISTDLGLYWIDNNNASICAIQAKQPNFVINLSEAKSCTNIVSFLRSVNLKDNPLNISTTTGNEGGIDIYNPYQMRLCLG